MVIRVQEPGVGKGAGRAARSRAAGPRVLVTALVWLLGAAMLWGLLGAVPGAVAVLAGAVPAEPDSVPRSLAGEARQVATGPLLLAPAGGRWQAAVPDGAAVPAGAELGRITGPAAARLQAEAAAATAALRRLEGTSRASGSGSQAERSALAARSLALASLAAAASIPIVAPQAGRVVWHVDPLALLPDAARTALPPTRLLAGPYAATAGATVAPGQVLGLVAPFGGDLFGVVVPAAEAAGVSGGLRATLRPGDRSATLVGWGPTVAGRCVLWWHVEGDAQGAARTAVTLSWGRVTGVGVPLTAVVRHAGGAWVLVAEGRRWRWQPVQWLGRAGGTALVAGLAAGTRVSARPWLGGLWAAGGW
jgi:hypothetical protein